jgi:type IV pilus assembly protein PilA
MSNKKSQSGFSLIELLIVVAIIGTVCAIAVPRLLNSRRAANEGSAISTMRTIHSVEASYQSTIGAGEYADLPTLVANRLLDSTFGSNVKSGYQFVVTPSPAGVRPANFFASAVPVITDGLSQTGSRRFGVCDDGVLRADFSMTAFGTRDEVTATPGLNN